jgi:hypothetical protein
VSSSNRPPTISRPGPLDLASTLSSPPRRPRWDKLAGLVAAYRETYNITSADPAAPLGPQPDTAGVKARAWKAITGQWKPPVTADQYDEMIKYAPRSGSGRPTPPRSLRSFQQT